MPMSAVRAARLAKWAAIPAALVVSGLVVGQASYSAYTSQTSNAGNNWSSGTVAIGDDDNNTAMFTSSNAGNLKPGATGSKCIAVTSTGSLASTVRLYGTSPGTTNGLSSHINLVITQGTGGGFSSCSGFTALSSGSEVFTGTLAAFGSGSTGFANGRGNWAPTGNGSETRVFKFDYTLASNAPDSTQNGTAQLGFTWEAQNS